MNTAQGRLAAKETVFYIDNNMRYTDHAGLTIRKGTIAYAATIPGTPDSYMVDTLICPGTPYAIPVKSLRQASFLFTEPELADMLSEIGRPLQEGKRVEAAIEDPCVQNDLAFALGAASCLRSFDTA